MYMSRQSLLTDFFSSSSGSNGRISHLRSQSSSPLSSSDRGTARNRRSVRREDTSQLIIDAGQKLIGVQYCKECRMSYDIDSLSDCLRHSKYHSRFNTTEWFSVRFKQLDLWKSSCDYIYDNTGYSFNIKASTRTSIRARLEEVVSECVNIELGYAPDLPVWDSLGRREAWMYVSHNVAQPRHPFIGAIVMVEPVSKESLFFINDTGSCLQEASLESEGPWMGVERLWVHHLLRGQRIATRLLDYARRYFCLLGALPRQNIAFNSPTHLGSLFARNYCACSSVLAYKKTTGI
ncbi:hypothetical protein AB6A40_008274 [Gnathostoma spinigerum]|uniref:N-acetyltransferase ECO1 n=1 Tax=Gnathostoma spinigerum TaxID=75299 RepID=A0ABD6EPV9_9BILA